jgi:hypothetical protein
MPHGTFRPIPRQPLPFAALDDREVDVVIGVNVLCSDPQTRWISADITNGKLKIKRLWSLSGYDPFLRVYMRSPEVTEGSAGKCTQESETPPVPRQKSPRFDSGKVGESRSRV